MCLVLGVELCCFRIGVFALLEVAGSIRSRIIIGVLAFRSVGVLLIRCGNFRFDLNLGVCTEDDGVVICWLVGVSVLVLFTWWLRSVSP